MTKFYIITFESGETRYMDDATYCEALNYAESRNDEYEYTIEEYESAESYYENL